MAKKKKQNNRNASKASSQNQISTYNPPTTDDQSARQRAPPSSSNPRSSNSRRPPFRGLPPGGIIIIGEGIGPEFMELLGDHRSSTSSYEYRDGKLRKKEPPLSFTGALVGVAVLYSSYRLIRWVWRSMWW